MTAKPKNRETRKRAAAAPAADSAPSRGDLVYRSLLAAMRAGEYRPGDRMVEEEVARKLGVSRTPVREALQSLHARRLIDIVPGKGTVVAELSVQQTLELYAMRAVLEGAAARFAAQHATEDEVAILKKLLEEFSGLGDRLAEAQRVNRMFHQMIYAAARSRYVQESLSNIEDSLALLQTARFRLPGRHKAALSEHRHILDAIARRDPDAAEIAGRRHIVTAQQAPLSVLLDR